MPWMIAAGREVGRRHDLDQLVDGAVGVAQHVQARVDGLAQVVRRDVRRHADRDAGRSVDQQVRQPRRQHQRLALRAVVVRAEVDGLVVDVREHLVRRSSPAGSRCSASPRRCRRRPNRSCPARRPACSAARSPAPSARSCRRSPCRRAGGTCRSRRRRCARTSCMARFQWLLSSCIAYSTRRCTGFRPSRSVGQRTPDDHAHRVVEIGPAHLLFETDRNHFLGERIHAGRSARRTKIRSA